MPESLAHPAVLVHLLLTFVPGLAIGLALGLRGWLLAASGPLLTYGLVGFAGSALPAIGLLWSPWSFATSAVVLTAVAAAMRLAAKRLPARASAAGAPFAVEAARWRPAHHVGIGLAVLVAAGTGALVAASATDGFDAVPQIWDSVFHANATRYIADTGQSAPAALQNLNDPVTSSFFYPNAYHVLAATVMMITGSTVPTVLDASTALFPALLALSIVALVRQRGARPALAVAAGLLSCAFTAFPYDLLPWGTLLPFIVAVALLPAFLAVFSAALDSTGGGLPTTAAALGLAGVGVLALHPSVAVAAAVLGAALLLQLWIQRRPQLHDLLAIGLTGVVAAVLGAPLLLASLRAAGGPAYDWPATLKPADALGQLFFLSHEQQFPQYWLAGLAFLGLFRIATLRPLLWFVVGSTFFGALFVLAAAYEGDLVTLLTGPWWNDRWRFVALWTLGAIVLAAAGVVALRDWAAAAATKLAPALRTMPERRRLIASGALLALLLALVTTLSDGLYQGRNETRLALAFTDGPTVSTDERRAFDELARIVAPGALVMNDSYDGSALMWALNDVRPVFASPVIAPTELVTMHPERRILFESFNRLDTDLAVQNAVAELNVSHAIACSGFIGPAKGRSAGMQGLDRVAALTPIYRSADCVIYAVNATAATAVRR